MRTKFFFAALLLSSSLFLLSSCNSREERTINKIDNLAKSIAKDGKDWDADDWEEAMEKLADIHEDMLDCEFTPEQMREVGRKDGRLSAIIAREGAKSLSKGAKGFVESFGSFAKGFQEGAEEEYNEKEMEKIGDDLEKEINELMKSFEE